MSESSLSNPASPDSPSDGEQDPLDLPRLEKLRALQQATGQDLLGQIIEIYLRDAPARLGEIRCALDDGEIPVAQRLAHSLKGSSSNLGAPAVEAVAGELERLLAQGTDAGSRVLLERLESEVGRACRALEELRS